MLALLCSLYSKQTFKVHLGVEKHIERQKNYNYEGRYATKMLNPPLIYLASVQTMFSFWRTTQNLSILALLCSSYNQQTF